MEDEVINEIVEVKDRLDLYDSLYTESNDIVQQIINEKDGSKLNDLTNLFKFNQKKKDILRANRLSNLLNQIDNEVQERITTMPESFDNYALLKYMEATQNSVSGIYQNIDKQPLIQINNQKNEININGSSGLDRDSRARVLEAVTAIINGVNNVIDVEETDG